MKTTKITKNKEKNRQKKFVKQIVINVTQDEFDYINFMYNKMYFGTRSSYVRKLICEDMEKNGYI